jgi:hypothetical protein
MILSSIPVEFIWLTAALTLLMAGFLAAASAE